MRPQFHRRFPVHDSPLAEVRGPAFVEEQGGHVAEVLVEPRPPSSQPQGASWDEQRHSTGQIQRVMSHVENRTRSWRSVKPSVTKGFAGSWETELRGGGATAAATGPP